MVCNLLIIGAAVAFMLPQGNFAISAQVTTVPYVETVDDDGALMPDFDLDSPGIFSSLPNLNNAIQASWSEPVISDPIEAPLENSYFAPSSYSHRATSEVPAVVLASGSPGSSSPEIFLEPDQDIYTQTIEPISVAPVGCSSCQLASSSPSSGCPQCQTRGRTRLGRFFQGVCAGICNPDPCYQPEWSMLANASLFTDAVTPQSRQRFRWDYQHEYQFPDRAEYLWGRSGVRGPAPERSINFHELLMYVETGSEKFSFFVETPYRSIYLESGGHFAGFADLTTGTKTLLHETPLLQVAFQFETHIPTSSPGKGLSTGHVSLEPSLLIGIQRSNRSFIQTQIGEWIPIAGDPDYAGASLKYSTSFNRTLFETRSNTSLTGTVEYSGLTFQDGAYTNPTTFLSARASGASIGMLGTGLRLNICDKLNLGLGVQYGVTDISPATGVRTEIQFRQ